MATRKSKTSARKPAAKKAAKPRASAAPAAAKSAAAAFTMPDPAQFAKFAKTMTPEQAFDLYKTNAKLALDIINAAIDNTAKVRRLQFEGEEAARSMQKKTARGAAEASDAQSLMAVGQTAAQEAVQHSMQYWSQMFELIADMQHRIFTLMETQLQGVPGVKEAKAAMAMLPDLRPAKDLATAMQGMLSSGGSQFESMQKAMADFARMAQQTIPGLKR